MTLEKLDNLARSLGSAYPENLRIRIKKDSPYYAEIAKLIGNKKTSMEMKRFLNLA